MNTPNMTKQRKLIGSAAVTFALGSVLIVGNAMFVAGAAVADVGSSAKTEAVGRSIILSSDASANEVSSVVETLPDGTAVITSNGNGSMIYSYNDENLSGRIYDASNNYIVGQPGNGDIDQEAAVLIAVKSITEKYALKQTVLNRFSIAVTYYTSYLDVSDAVWVVELNPINASDFSKIGCYTVVLNAEAGEVIQLRSAADGLG